jgi:hypothetical protein
MPVGGRRGRYLRFECSNYGANSGGDYVCIVGPNFPLKEENERGEMQRKSKMQNIREMVLAVAVRPVPS